MAIKFGEIEITDKSRNLVNQCLQSGKITMGERTKELEGLWAKKFGYKSVKAVSSGTAACLAACMALYDLKNAKAGDEIIVPALSFIATANAVRAAGFTPIFCDVKEGSLVIDETKIESLITQRTIAIMPVSLMGKPPKMDIIRSIANKRSLYVILDNCEGHGCKYQGKYMSEWADMVCYSCYAAHILFAGEFGFVGCSSQMIGELIESIRSHGRPGGSLYFNHERYGLNLKPTDLHACIGLGSFQEFNVTYNKRRENVNELTNALKHLNQLFWFCEEEEGSENSPHAFSLVVKPNSGITINGLQKALTEVGVEWKRNFGSMPTQHKCFAYLNHKLGDFPIAEYIGDNGLHIGVHPKLTTSELQTIVNAIRGYCE